MWRRRPSAGITSFFSREVLHKQSFAISQVERPITSPVPVSAERPSLELEWAGGGKARLELLCARPDVWALGGALVGKFKVASLGGRTVDSVAVAIVQTEICKGAVVSSAAVKTGKSSSSSSSSSSSAASSSSASSSSSSSSSASTASSASAASTARCVELTAWKSEATKPTELLAIDISLPLSHTSDEEREEQGEEGEAPPTLRASLPMTKGDRGGGVEVGVTHSLEVRLKFAGSADDVVGMMPIALGHGTKPALAAPRGTLVGPDGSSNGAEAGGDPEEMMAETMKDCKRMGWLMLFTLLVSFVWVYVGQSGEGPVEAFVNLLSKMSLTNILGGGGGARQSSPSRSSGMPDYSWLP